MNNRGSSTTANAPRLRVACDNCHQLKVRCSGGLPCENCVHSDNICFYSVANRLGRPKGAKNKRPRPASRPADSDLAVPELHRLQPDQSRITTSTNPNIDINVSRQERPPTPSDPQDLAMTGTTEARHAQWGPSSYELPGLLDDNWDYTGLLTSLEKDTFHSGQQHEPYSKSVDPSQKQYSPMLDPGGSISGESTLVATVDGSPRSPGDIDMSSLSQIASKLDTTIGCPCLQQHTELLCSLKRSRLLLDSEGDGNVQIGRVLSNTQEVLTASKTLADCRDCADNDDQEVLLLSVMCIRAVVSQLQRVFWKAGFDELVNEECGVGAGGGALTTAKEVQMLVGDFEVIGNDKSILLQALRSITLRKIETVLGVLKEVVLRKRRLQVSLHAQQQKSSGAGAVLVDYQHDTSSLAHVEKTMQGLTQFIKVLHTA